MPVEVWPTTPLLPVELPHIAQPVCDVPTTPVLLVENPYRPQFDPEVPAILQEAGHNLALLVSDIRLNGDMPGSELAEFARKLFPDIKVIMTSGKERPPVPDGAIFLRKHVKEPRVPAYERVLSAYDRLLHVSLEHRGATLVACLGVFAASLLLVPFIGAEFMPHLDEGSLWVRATMPT